MKNPRRKQMGRPIVDIRNQHFGKLTAIEALSGKRDEENLSLLARCKVHGVSHSTVRHRLNRDWSLEDALVIPTKSKCNK
jgi:hypothetical protein